MNRIIAGLCCALAASLPSCRDTGDTYFSIAPDKSVLVPGHFPSSFHFVRSFALGEEEGDPRKEFGIIFAATWTPKGEIIVADPQLGRIVQFDRSGGFRRTFGHPGSGPGELLSAMRILATDTTVIIYDERQHRITIFDTTAAYRSSFQPTVGRLSDMDFDPSGDLLLLTGAQSGRPAIYRYTVTGEVVDSFASGPYLPPALPEAPDGGAGAVCVSDTTIYYANAYIPEIVAFDARTYRVRWAKRYSTEYRFAKSALPGRRLSLHDIIVGVVCDSAKLLLAHIETQTGIIYYELYDTDGRPLGRIAESTKGTTPYTGYLAGLRRDSVLAYSNRPFAQIRIYELRKND
jgi:hypothetical protein